MKKIIQIIAFVICFSNMSSPLLHADDNTAFTAMISGKLEKGKSYITVGFVTQVGDGFVLLAGTKNQNFMVVKFEGDQMDSIGFMKGAPWSCKATFVGFKVLEMADSSQERMPIFQYQEKI